ncbi:hypothetical protein J2X65_003204 [Ancylobacter sp. 3268]|uniref:DUF1643 domain-containing protein n=1 Tax=Ancylobacter sp. 3268 TaxID=2817752 RepID=UPI00285C710C|nr:DUF1643 domain-containing protein [Ancylobacter sp. 3268]MDR6953841.1 hypothetical protein [Ancylobacter sp. 3268]
MSIHTRLSAPAMLADAMPIFVKMREWAEPGVRLKLVRWWGPVQETDPLRWLPWIMLNPSTANGTANDPTLLRIIHFTALWGFNGLSVFNVYPFRTPSPQELARTVVGWHLREDWGVRDQIRDNHRFIAKDLVHADAAMVAWGSPGGALGADTDLWLESLFDTINDPDGPRSHTLRLWCLGMTKTGAPIHPMARGKHRVANDARPIPFPNPGTISIGEPEEQCHG